MREGGFGCSVICAVTPVVDISFRQRLRRACNSLRSMRHITDIIRAGHSGVIRFLLCRRRHTESREGKYVQVQSSSVDQVARDSQVWDCRSIGCHSPDSCAVAVPPSGGCSSFPVSLRDHVHCVVWRSYTWTARDSSLRSRFLLLLLASAVFAGRKTPRDTTPPRFYRIQSGCRIADGGAKERDRIGQTSAR